MMDKRCKRAVVAMRDLAEHGKDRPVKLADLARRQHLSGSYYEQIFSKLKKAGLVAVVRGPGGGYQISNIDMSVDSIVEAISGKQPCSDRGWGVVVKKVGNELKGIKLRDLLL